MSKISIADAIAGSDYTLLLTRGIERAYRVDTSDLMHANSIKIVQAGAAPTPWGDRTVALISLPTVDAVIAIDLETARLVWALSGLWGGQHDARFLPNGHLLVFDNSGGGRAGMSRSVEVDPLTDAFVWSYGGRAGQPLWSLASGTNQRLPNGNTLVVESTNGRAVEVTPSDQIVWEFLSPHRAGRRNELVAALFKMLRYSASDVKWLSVKSE
jgi:hypothetical protein